MKSSVSIMEVCPRDGWQNLPDFIPTERKIHYIERMLDAGVQTLQVTSFVHPKAIPQLRDAALVARTITGRYPDRTLTALVPNLHGARAAVENGIREVNYVVSVSETHNLKNIGRTHSQSFAELQRIRRELPDLKITLGCATTFGCPFEGQHSLGTILRFIERGADMGADQLELSDTVGMGDPRLIQEVFSAVKRTFPQLPLMAHLHDTRNNGVLNCYLALESGADMVHTALGGLGGCPFAPGASGNTSTEDLVYLLEKSGVRTGIDFEKILGAARDMRREIPGNYSGHQIHIPPEGACPGGEGRRG
ncbi:hydroxymethylglutaryl-CoA lyase [uncultured Oscillibacter sp.]|uniref:hydroxymethylglutaryl-CoA lyase n=1 Tax=uncultured Oscillibacter sp. TaxID=876091 RepID=UPI0025D447A6|nr:hydroxymethylglutaryl-CoA lyase [uncultured Oscillibacter sp.]